MPLSMDKRTKPNKYFLKTITSLPLGKITDESPRNMAAYSMYLYGVNFIKSKMKLEELQKDKLS